MIVKEDTAAPIKQFCREHKLMILFFAAVWVFLVLLTAKKSLTWFLLNEITPNYELFYLRGVVVWTIAAAFAPWIVRLSKAYPLEGRRRIRHFFYHTLFSVIFLFVMGLFFSFVWQLWHNPVRLLQNFSSGLFYNLMWMSLIVPVVYWLVMIVFHFKKNYDRYMIRRNRTLLLQSELKKIQLRVLQMQLQPHFLFNALNTVSALLYNDLETADKMLGKIRQFLQISLDDTHHPEIPLRDELEFTDMYLEIEKERFGDRLQIKKQIDEQSLQALVPRMVLQPIVENAIRHGISNKEGLAELSISAESAQDKLHLRIEDSGKGFMPGSVEKRGLGLKNTIERLQKLYDQKYSFTVDRSELGGAKIALEIPWYDSDKNQQRMKYKPS